MLQVKQFIIFKFLLCFSLLSGACYGPDEDPEEPTIFDDIHYNITIAPDLSNRIDTALYPRALSDVAIVNGFLDAFYPEIVTYDLSQKKEGQRKTGQKDVLRIDFINQKMGGDYKPEDMELNLDRFGKNQAERIQYLTNQSVENLDRDTKKFKQEYAKLNDAVLQKNVKADVWSYFKNGIKSNLLDNKIDSVLNKKQHSLNRSFACNVLVLFTDGYIEAGLYGEKNCEGNKCYFLDSKRVADFRIAFKKSGSSDIKAFFQQEGYGIIPVENPLLQNLNVLVMEMYDRSIDASGKATQHPSDWEILQLFWEDWLTKSGVKSHRLLSTASSQREAMRHVQDFLRSRPIE
ncbi:hypothetical protein [Sphingobacterium corticibacter]|uniref:Uncharacterized protein n=1 Tax=Sphingobacterium corticibacter TaxID=2171749 RepID=A0A2T8HMD4_9SPHI|nr:hypothetical protein [Sphingobacterium corticibacter]PVH26596.1 hypothetical protein DC487_03005 [Sphingobacterium corticibacter]